MSTPQQIAMAASPEKVTSPWHKHTSQWHRIGPPLRPCDEDVAWFQSELDDIGRVRAHVSALLMGVTSEITALQWPVNSELFAVDLSDSMVRQHWRSPQGIEALAVRGSWLQQPLESGTVNCVIGDGSLSILADLNGLTQVVAELARVLEPGGRLILRTFVRLERESSQAEVLQALHAGKIGSFHAFKWRLVMAMHSATPEGVLLGAVHAVVEDAIPDRQRLALKLGWDRASIDTIDAYRGVQGRYFFPSMRQLRAVLASYFVETRCRLPTYEIGERCPLMVMTRK